MPPNDSAEQKSEQPTQRKRQRAREEGQVAQSTEINNAAVLLASAGAMILFGGGMFRLLLSEVGGRLGQLHRPVLTLAGASDLLGDTFQLVIGAALPITACVAFVGVACSLAQTGVMVTPKLLGPKFDQINPIKGFKNLVSGSSVVKLLVAVAKLAILGLVIYTLVRSRIPWFFALVGKSPWGIMHMARQMSVSIVTRAGLAMLILAAADYAYQRLKYEKQLMMSKQEVRDESKRDEGSPEVRARQDQVRRSLARSRMMAAVPEADVVVANPTHLAVALRWSEEEMGAPTVVAKGQGWLAERIKQIARENGVPVLERKSLAQALHKAVEVGMEIPSQLYYAVAEVLAYVMGGGKRAA